MSSPQTSLQIIVSPDPRLLQKAEPVSVSELSKLRQTALKMAKLMYESYGCGIAAPQVGISKRLIVVDPDWGLPDEETGEVIPQRPQFFLNPEIRRLWGEQDCADEGCLSVPGITVPVERFEFVELAYLDLDGNPHQLTAAGFFARVLQHELDHLEGITLFEHLDPITRIDAFQEYQEAIAAGAKPGDTKKPGSEQEDDDRS